MRYLFQIGKSPISRFPTPTLLDRRFPTLASDDGFATSDGGLAFVPESRPQPLKAALPSYSSPGSNSDQRFSRSGDPPLPQHLHRRPDPPATTACTREMESRRALEMLLCLESFSRPLLLLSVLCKEWVSWGKMKS
ncbi:unnamed protein product [Linum trigynum]|uniref:Uncharacterized protein n=1 Tax=Linum trigynum TaxID=586398 RepID=A0AAV2CYJ5_9ROSI